MNINDIPSELLHKIRIQFERDPKVQRLRIQQRLLKDNGDYAGALGIGRSIEDIYTRVVQGYMEEAESQVEKISIDRLDIPNEDKERIMTLGLVLFMAADIIETAVMDVDDIIHRYDKDLHFEMFNDIRQISAMAKDKLRFFGKNSSYMKDLVWAEKCDDMYAMCQSKARSIIRKKRDNPSWGENYKKVMEGLK